MNREVNAVFVGSHSLNYRSKSNKSNTWRMTQSGKQHESDSFLRAGSIQGKVWQKQNSLFTRGKRPVHSLHWILFICIQGSEKERLRKTDGTNLEDTDREGALPGSEPRQTGKGSGRNPQVCFKCFPGHFIFTSLKPPTQKRLQQTVVWRVRRCDEVPTDFPSTGLKTEVKVRFSATVRGRGIAVWAEVPLRFPTNTWRCQQMEGVETCSPEANQLRPTLIINSQELLFSLISTSAFLSVSNVS